MVGGSIRIPKVQEIAKDIFKTTELDRSINPDEVVAIGAAIQGGVLQGEVKDVLLLDVTPLSLGVETLGGVMTKLIERNTTIPTSKKETFSTAADNQSSVTIHVLQGDREFAADNRSLGRFDLTGLPPAPRGVPQVEVEFSIDANGIMNVSATDKATGKKQEIRITGSSGLSKEEVDRMRREAEENAAGDRQRRELVDIRNSAEQLMYATRKGLEEHGSRISAEARSGIESAVSNLETKVKTDDRPAIEAAMKALNEAAAELGKAAYEASKSAGGAESAGGSTANDSGKGGSGAASGGKGDVIDAEYEVKDGN